MKSTIKRTLVSDEFTDNGNWAHQLYIMEARHMTGEYVHMGFTAP